MSYAMQQMKTTMMRLGWAACVVGALAFAAAACSGGSDLVVDAGDNGNGNNGNGNNGNGNNGNGNGGGDGDAGTNGNGNGEGSLACDGTTQCSDGIDNDLDGFIDLEDPHCASCFDDNEFSFNTGIPGDNQGARFQDCFFDGDSGSGNDGCQVETCCYDPNNDRCTMYEEDGSMSAICAAGFTEKCIEICGSASPPGCDCIGCCTVCDPDTGDCADIFRGADFSDYPDCHYNNLSACPTCEKADICGGPDCEDDECVLCAGQSEDDLPDHCFEGDARCPGGTACSNNNDCEAGQYCALGCCLNEIS
jgi:hypothetical protein